MKNIKIPGAIFEWCEMWEEPFSIKETILSCEGFSDLDEFVKLVNSSILKDYSDWILNVNENETRLTNPKTKDYFLGNSPDDNPLAIPSIELHFNKFNPSQDTIEITYEEYNNLKDVDKIHKLVESCLWNLEVEDGGLFFEDDYVVNSDDFMKEVKEKLNKLYNKNYD